MLSIYLQTWVFIVMILFFSFEFILFILESCHFFILCWRHCAFILLDLLPVNISLLQVREKKSTHCFCHKICRSHHSMNTATSVLIIEGHQDAQYTHWFWLLPHIPFFEIGLGSLGFYSPDSWSNTDCCLGDEDFAGWTATKTNPSRIFSFVDFLLDSISRSIFFLQKTAKNQCKNELLTTDQQICHHQPMKANVNFLAPRAMCDKTFEILDEKLKISLTEKLPSGSTNLNKAKNSFWQWPTMWWRTLSSVIHPIIS